MLNTMQAWEFLGKLWETPSFDEVPFVKIGGERAIGLCRSIGLLLEEGMIGKDDWNEMQMKVVVCGPQFTNDFPYRWPTSKEGAKQRSEFCYRMKDKTALSLQK